MNAEKTTPMMIAAAKMTRPTPATPSVTACRALPPLHVLLADPAQEEDLVVHREPEQDREHDHGQVRRSRPGLVEPDQAGPQPHSKTATSAPKAASAESEVVSAALSAITTDRSAIVRTRR